MNHKESSIFYFCNFIKDDFIEGNNISNEECYKFVKNKLDNSSFFIKYGVIYLTVLLNFSLFFRFGHGLNKLTKYEKKYLYKNLKTSKLGLKKDLLKFYESFVILIVYTADR